AGAIGFPWFSMVGVALMCSAGAERECARVVRELNVLAGTSGRLIRIGVDGFLEVEHGADVDLRRESSCERGAGEPFANRSWVADDRPRNSLALYRRDAAGRLRNSRMGQVDEEFDAGRARTFAVPEWTGRGIRGRDGVGEVRRDPRALGQIRGLGREDGAAVSERIREQSAVPRRAACEVAQRPGTAGAQGRVGACV